MTKQTFILTDSVFCIETVIFFPKLETLDRCTGRDGGGGLTVDVYVTVCAGFHVLHEVCFPAWENQWDQCYRDKPINICRHAHAHPYHRHVFLRHIHTHTQYVHFLTHCSGSRCSLRTVWNIDVLFKSPSLCLCHIQSIHIPFPSTPSNRVKTVQH